MQNNLFFAEQAHFHMYFRQKEKVSPKVCNQLVAHLGGPGLFLFYDNSCQDVERPPAPSPVCNELVALF